MLPKFLSLIVFSSVFASPALADLRTHLGVLADQAATAIKSPWSAGEQDGWFVLTNETDESEQVLVVNAGPPPAAGRTTTVNLTILPTDQTASIGIFLDDRAQDALCLMEITGAGDANLFCVEGGKRIDIASKAKVGKLDGSDVITMQETPGKADFYVNDQYIGQVANHPALDGSVGLMFYDRGTFAVTSYAMTEGGDTGQPDGGDASSDLVSIIGPLADEVSAKEIKAGWEAFTQDGWLVLENKVNGEDSFGYAPTTGAPDQGGRAASVYLAMTAPEGTEWAAMAASSAGLIMQNNGGSDVCSGEINGAGDAVMTCWDAQGGHEIGRLPGAAKFDGNDVISLVEWPGIAQFWANNQMIGEVKNNPAQNGDVGIISYGKGTFWFAGYNLVALDSGSGTESGPTGTTTVASANGDGPLPMFDGDSARITGTYLGVLTGIFLHEFGHALIGELQLPSTGPEEDAVDIFSALRISAPESLQGPDEAGTAINQLMAKYATLQWYYSGMVTEQQGGDVPWQDEHTADLKRFRNTFCVIFGSNPSLWSDLAQQVQMDERTLDRCNREFTKQNRAWRSILAPYTRVSAAYPDGMQKPDAAGAAIIAVFEPSTRQVGNMVKSIIGDSGTFQEYINILAKDFVLPRDVVVTFKDCGELNAWYQNDDGTVTMCYDLIEYIVAMISDVEMGTSGGYPVDGSNAPVASNDNSGGAVPFAASTPVVETGAFNEMEDFGIPTTWALFSAPYNGPTPVSNPAATLVTTDQLAGILQDQNAKWMLVDTRGQGQTLPNALIEKEAALDGSLTDGFQDIVAEWLAGQTAGNPEMYLIFFGNGPADRSAYNAALRAGAIGQYANVLWYRGGEEAWTANGHPLADAPQ